LRSPYRNTTAPRPSPFALPGIGKLTLDSVFTRDYPVLQAVVLVITASYIVINLLVDLLYTLIDPRIRVSGRTS
jgi:peptide/nickel transport system permease protein